MNLWMDLACAASSDPTWRDRYIEQAKALLPSESKTPSQLGNEIQIFSNYAREVGRLSDIGEALGALGKARDLADRIRTLSERVPMYCEIAEAGAAGGFIVDADLLFKEARSLVPSHMTGPLGSKAKDLRGFLIAQWLSSVAKALTKAIGQGGMNQRDVGILRTWSDWVIDPSNRDANWAVPAKDGGEMLLAQLNRTEDSDEVKRAQSIAAGWRAQFDHTCPHEQRKHLMEVCDNSVLAITSPTVRTKTHRDLAVMEAYASFYDRRRAYYALYRTRIIGASAKKDDVIHRIGTAFARNYLTAMADAKPDARMHLDLFLSTIGDCAESHTSSYIALASLVRCFPEAARTVDAVLTRRSILEAGSDDE